MYFLQVKKTLYSYIQLQTQQREKKRVEQKYISTAHFKTSIKKNFTDQNVTPNIPKDS